MPPKCALTPKKADTEHCNAPELVGEEWIYCQEKGVRPNARCPKHGGAGKPGNRLPFQWTPEMEEIAVLYSRGEITISEIAFRLGKDPSNCGGYVVGNPAFARRVDELRAEYRRIYTEAGIGEVQARVAKYVDEIGRIEATIAERGADPEMQHVPGGKHGLLVKRLKGIGSKEDFQVVEEYEADVALLRERRETLKQAAQDLGQWTEKRQDSGDLTIRVVYEENYDPAAPRQQAEE